jgi:hypothetical protein
MKNIEDYIVKQGRYRGKLNQKELQTGNDKGTYKFGGDHPFVAGLGYRGWIRGQEVWATLESLKVTKNKQVKYSVTDARKNSKNKYNRSKKGREAYAKFCRTSKGKSLSNYHWNLRNAKIKKASSLLSDYEKSLIKHIYDYKYRLQAKVGILFEVDHIVPIKKGGLHHPNNLQVVPKRWNRIKSASNTDQWLPNGL